jgi:signal transduction histidine kinase
MQLVSLILVSLISIALIVMVVLWKKMGANIMRLEEQNTRYKQEEQRVANSERWMQLLQASVTNLDFGVVIIDPALHISLVNHQAEILLGISAHSAINQPYQPILQIVDEQNQPIIGATDTIFEIYQSRQPQEHKECFMNINGTATPMQVSWIPLQNDQHQIEGGLVILRNLAHQKQLDEMKVDFVSIVSHELRTPITAVKGYVDILLHEVQLDPEHTEMLRRVYASNERQLETVESLLNLSRLERGTVPIHPQLFQIEEMVGQVVGELEPMAKTKGLTIKFDYPRFALPKVWADPDRTREVLSNLVSNGLKYTDEGWVKISLEKQDKMLQITVTDSGPGITPEVQAKLFAKFQRGEGVLTESRQGMGLGLYITKQFVELMGGQIAVSSESGNGSTFTFTVPTQ